MDRFELAAQAANDGLWDWDLTTNRIHFSNRWSSMLGSEESILGNTPEEWFKRIHPDDLERVQSKIKSHLENGSNKFTIEHRMLHKDKSYRWMSCRAVITRNKIGEAIRLSGSHSDTTGEKVADDLTGLPNRTLLLDRLTRSIEMTRKNSSTLFAVLILDLDLPEYMIERFKQTDRDLLLAAVARRLETCLRTSDTISHPGCDHVVARSNGEEFIILMEGFNEVNESKIVADRLLQEISTPFEVNCREVFLSASIGIALSATGYQNAQEVLRDADTALYRAKSLGKSRCEVFDTALLKSAKAKLELEADLHRALKEQEFSVFYQPIISLSSRRIVGLEALVRWQHPIRGMISPADFIPTAEKTGIIIPLGLWVIREVCQKLKLWKENPNVNEDLWISLNLSSVQFRHPSLVKDVCKVLLDVGHDANSILLELTEGEVMENPETANRVLMQLRVTGARIALDDFGTGYSSLAHLCRFPLDYLKIDQSFVKSIETDNDSREIVRTINSLAHQLGLRVIAEGIENQGQLDLISSIGCEYGQGFLFSEAVSKDKVESLLRNDFISFNADTGSVMIPDEEDTKYAPIMHESTTLPIGNPGVDNRMVENKHEKYRVNRALILIGTAAIMLLFTAGLLKNFKAQTPTFPLKEMQLPITEEITSESPSRKPTIVQTSKTPPFLEFPVVHDHFIGNCKGTLKVTNETVSYTSENDGCSFNLSYNEMDYFLDKDQLEISTESKKYHFKLTNFTTKEENRSHLQEIFDYISKSSPRR